MRLSRRCTTLAVVLCLIAPVSSALAAITQRSGGTTGSTCTGGGSPTGDCRFSRQELDPVGIGTNQFISRFAWNINADATAASVHDTSGTAVHTMSFMANAPGGYRLTVRTYRDGNLSRTADDAGCDGSGDTSGISGTSNVAVASGTLDLADPGEIPSGGTTVNLDIDQTATATIYGVSNGVDQPHTLSFTWDGAVHSASCEMALRQGESGGTTTGCTSCTYPGGFPNLAAADGHVVDVTLVSLCGNGTIDAQVGEECDQASFNGSAVGCCTATCRLKTAGTVCRAQSGVCDVAETCDGLNGACPAQGFAPSGTVCRAATGGCDVAETCTGSTNSCPADTFHSAGTVCRPVAGVCDREETCSGSSPSCPGDGVLLSSVVCRPSAGACDVAEHCTNLPGGVHCPPDAFVAGTVECRASAGECDAAELCTGSAAACPTDAKIANGTACSSDGAPCTIDQCDGASDACQHPFESAGVVCRAAAGVCDVAETCDGASAGCPSDGLEPASVVCRPEAGQCDVAEHCTGATADCPTDALAPDGTSCDDAMSCTIEDVCAAGICTGDSETCGDGVVQGGCAEECDDGNTDANDGCSPTCQTEIGLACNPTPETGCTVPFIPGKAQLTIKDRSPDSGDQLQWSWAKGGLTTVAELGDPTTTTSYRLCIYDPTGLVHEAGVPAGGVCAGKFCWSPLGSAGFKYMDKAGASDGVTQLLLRQGVDGKARIQLKAKGAALQPPAPASLAQPLRVQLANTAGNCWEAVYSAPASTQTPEQFRDKAD